MILKQLLPVCAYSERPRFTPTQDNLNLYFKISLSPERRYADLKRAGSKQSPNLMHHLSKIKHENVISDYNDPTCSLAPKKLPVLDLMFTLNIYSQFILSFI
jgi:hypothetical protein